MIRYTDSSQITIDEFVQPFGGHLEVTLTLLSEGNRLAIPAKVWRKFWIIQELYRQQREMHSARIHRCDDRIVSIGQPHVRPIVRRKRPLTAKLFTND